MDTNKELQENIQELNQAEQHLQNFLLQKQTFQIELNETNSALEEVKKTKGNIYKIVGQVMVKVNKEDIIKELEEKRDTLNLRIKAIENQEKILRDKIENTRKLIEEKLRKREKKGPK